MVLIFGAGAKCPQLLSEKHGSSGLCTAGPHSAPQPGARDRHVGGRWV